MAKTGVPLYSGLTYSILLEQAIESGSITEDNRRDLAEWRDAPFEWGANHNHPPVKKN